MNDGLLVVISAPSGGGKDTIVGQIISEMKDEATLSVSLTTREIRPGEKEGVDYYYVSKEEFFEKVENNGVLEYAQYGENFYGTPIDPVKSELEKGKTVFLIIEVEGGSNVKKIFPECVKIFIAPPSMKVLEKRLRGRGTDSEDAIRTRLKIAESEMNRISEYDYVVINDKLEEAIADVKAIIKSEKLKTKKMINKINEVIENV